MDFLQETISPRDRILVAFLGRLKRILAAMDSEYGIAAEHYGFHCDGCMDNCCQTRFHHHTHLEYLLIREGFSSLDPQAQRQLIIRAREVCLQLVEADADATPVGLVRVMCPLNFDSLCSLYPYRPMICRLHGIPHELQKPGRRIDYGPGCGTFDDRCSDERYLKFDRTPFYYEMAKLENEFKQAIGITGRIKMTIAEMIFRFD